MSSGDSSWETYSDGRADISFEFVPVEPPNEKEYTVQDVINAAMAADAEERIRAARPRSLSPYNSTGELGRDERGNLDRLASMFTWHDNDFPMIARAKDRMWRSEALVIRVDRCRLISFNAQRKGDLQKASTYAYIALRLEEIERYNRENPPPLPAPATPAPEPATGCRKCCCGARHDRVGPWRKPVCDRMKTLQIFMIFLGLLFFVAFTVMSSAFSAAFGSGGDDADRWIATMCTVTAFEPNVPCLDSDATGGETTMCCCVTATYATESGSLITATIQRTRFGGFDDEEAACGALAALEEAASSDGDTAVAVDVPCHYDSGNLDDFDFGPPGTQQDSSSAVRNQIIVTRVIAMGGLAVCMLGVAISLNWSCCPRRRA